MIQLKSQLKNISQSPEGGYTLMEGLVAMTMVAALMVAVAPVIAFSVGTRVQARRIELGAQAARSYIDAVRSNPLSDDDGGNAPEILVQNPNSTAAPNGGSLICPTDGDYCGSPPNKDLALYCIDGGDGGGCTSDSLTDMVIQTGRYNPTSADANQGYQLMVRVYRGDAFQETTLEKGTQQSSVTNAIGNRKQPVIEIVTEIGPTDSPFQNLRKRIDALSN